jgi:hypothetical protein
MSATVFVLGVAATELATPVTAPATPVTAPATSTSEPHKSAPDDANHPYSTSPSPAPAPTKPAPQSADRDAPAPAKLTPPPTVPDTPAPAKPTSPLTALTVPAVTVPPLPAVSAGSGLAGLHDDALAGAASLPAASAAIDNAKGIVGAGVVGTILSYSNPGVAVGGSYSLDHKRIASTSIVDDGTDKIVRATYKPRADKRYMITGHYPVFHRPTYSVGIALALDQTANVSLGVNLQLKMTDRVGMTINLLISETDYERLADGFIANAPTKETSVRFAMDTGFDVTIAVGIAHWK